MKGLVPALGLSDDETRTLQCLLDGLDGRVSFEPSGRAFITRCWGWNRKEDGRDYVSHAALDVIGGLISEHRFNRGGRVIIDAGSGWVLCADCDATIAHLFEATGAPALAFPARYHRGCRRPATPGIR